MRHVFSFFFRLLLSFLGAKLMLYLADWYSLNALIVITLALLGNIYIFDFLDYRSLSSWRRNNASPPPAAPPVSGGIPEPPPET